MLCPEVWDLRAPQHCFKVDESDSTTRNVTGTIKKHYFNHSVSVILPDTTNLPHNFVQSFDEDNDYYRVNNLPAHELVDKEFIEAFVKNGEVNVLAIDRRIDVDSTLALAPSGHLVLSLNNELFQGLGIEGSPCYFERNIKSRFVFFLCFWFAGTSFLVVTIDLKEDSFVPGKKNYERVRSSLANNLPEKFNVILAWDPPDDKLCPSSIAAWFSKRGYDVKLCRQKRIDRTEYCLKIPVIDETTDQSKLFEWLGVFNVGGQLDGENSYVNSYKCPEPSAPMGQIRCVRWTGFMTRKQIATIYQELRNHVEVRGGIPWASLDVQGFSDSPISWELKEHNYFVDGDNSYALFMKPSGKLFHSNSKSMECFIESSVVHYLFKLKLAVQIRFTYFEQMEKKLLIVDCDAGIDDALALVILTAAHRVKRIKLLAITCVNGNTVIDNVVNNVFRTLKACGTEDVPVYKGASSQLLSAENFRIAAAELVHGGDGFGDIFTDKPDISKLQKDHAVHALYKIVSDNPEKISIACLGPLTNIALAIKLYPDFVKNVKEFFVMGGNHIGIGNVTPQAEFNFYADPESVHIFLANNVKPHLLLPWEACIKSEIPREWRTGVLSKIGTPQTRLLDAIEHSLYFTKNEACFIYRPCDAILAGIILRPDSAKQIIRRHADIELFGSRTRGQVVIDHLESREPNVDIVTEYDGEIFKELMIFAVDPDNYRGNVLQ